MNKSPALLVTLVAVFAAGCGGGSNNSANNSSSTNGGTSSTGSGKDVKIGLVTDVGGLNDRGFNHLAYLGVQAAAAKLGVQYKVNLSASSGEYVPNLSDFARKGYDLTIGVGFTEANAIDTVATQFPKRSSRSSTSTRPASRTSRRTC